MKLIDYVRDGDFVAAGKNTDDLQKLIARVRKKRGMFRWIFAIAMAVITAGCIFLFFKMNPILKAMTTPGEAVEVSDTATPEDMDDLIFYSGIFFRSVLPPFGAMALVGFVYATGFSSSLRSLLLLQSYLEHSENQASPQLTPSSWPPASHP